MIRTGSDLRRELRYAFPAVERVDFASVSGDTMVGLTIGKRTAWMTFHQWVPAECALDQIGAAVLGLLHSAMRDIPRRKILRRRVRR